MTWKVQLDQWGRATAVQLDDRTIEGVAGVIVTAVPGQPPSLTLYAETGVTIEGEGVVQVIDDDAGSPRQVVLEWLATIDAAWFEKAMLESLGGFGGPTTTAEGALAALRQAAETIP